MTHDNVTDIVDRLRYCSEHGIFKASNDLMAAAYSEAADTIASLRKQLEDARAEALEEAAECAERYPIPMNEAPMALTVRLVATSIRKMKGIPNGKI